MTVVAECAADGQSHTFRTPFSPSKTSFCAIYEKDIKSAPHDLAFHGVQLLCFSAKLMKISQSRDF